MRTTTIKITARREQTFIVVHFVIGSVLLLLFCCSYCQQKAAHGLVVCHGEQLSRLPPLAAEFPSRMPVCLFAFLPVCLLDYLARSGLECAQYPANGACPYKALFVCVLIAFVLMCSMPQALEQVPNRSSLHKSTPQTNVS